MMVALWIKTKPRSYGRSKTIIQTCASRFFLPSHGPLERIEQQIIFGKPHTSIPRLGISYGSL